MDDRRAPDEDGSVMTGWRLPSRVAVIVVTAAVLAGLGGGAGSARPAPACVAKGPRFVVYPVHGGPAGAGSTYLVHTFSEGAPPLGCGVLRAMLTRIFRANPMPWPPASPKRPRGAKLKGAPKGFACVGQSTNPSGKDVNNITGTCILAAGTASSDFDWAPVDPTRLP